MKKILFAALASAAFMATPANAEVNYDPTTGGTVGKGDVQSAFGWNNATLQAEWAGGEISFRYDSSTDYEITCEWTAGKSGNVQVKTSTISAGLNATVAAEGKQRNQIVGFILGAAGSGGGDAPSIGGSCQAEGNNGAITAVTELGSSGGGGLYVVWNGQEVLLQAD